MSLFGVSTSMRIQRRILWRIIPTRSVFFVFVGRFFDDRDEPSSVGSLVGVPGKQILPHNDYFLES